METLIKGELVYVAAPYSAKLPNGDEYTAKIEQRMFELSFCVTEMVKFGLHPITPLLMHYVRKEVGYSEVDGDWDYWASYSYQLLGVCTKLIVLKMPGWKDSAGVQAEIHKAKANGIAVMYLDPQKVKEGIFEDEGE